MSMKTIEHYNEYVSIVIDDCGSICVNAKSATPCDGCGFCLYYIGRFSDANLKIARDEAARIALFYI